MDSIVAPTRRRDGFSHSLDPKRTWGFGRGVLQLRHVRDDSAQHRAGMGEGADRAEEPRLQHAPPSATGAPRCGGAKVMVIRGEVCLESPVRGKQTRRRAGEYRKPVTLFSNSGIGVQGAPPVPSPPCPLVDDLARWRHHQPRPSIHETQFKMQFKMQFFKHSLTGKGHAVRLLWRVSPPQEVESLRAKRL